MLHGHLYHVCATLEFNLAWTLHYDLLITSMQCYIYTSKRYFGGRLLVVSGFLWNFELWTLSMWTLYFTNRLISPFWTDILVYICYSCYTDIDRFYVSRNTMCIYPVFTCEWSAGLSKLSLIVVCFAFIYAASIPIKFTVKSICHRNQGI